MVCTDKQKVWVHVKPHRKRVWKCFDEKRNSKKITRPLNVADFVRAPGYRRSQRKRKPTRVKLKPPRRARPLVESPEKLIVKLPLKYYNVTRSVPSFPVKKGPIKYAEDYQLQGPTQFGSKKSRRRGKTKDDPIIID